MRKRKGLRLVIVAVIVLAVGALLYAVPLLLAGRALERQLDQAEAALRSGDWASARTELTELSADASRLRDRLSGPVSAVLARVPIAGRSIRAARAIAESGTAVTDVAIAVLPALEQGQLWDDGRIDIAGLRPLRDVAEQQRPALERALARVESSPGWPLPGPLARARSELIDRLASSIGTTEIAVSAIDLSERVLGGRQERRYFIAFENPSELRGAGGLWGNYGILTANDGRLGLGRFGRISEIQRFATHPGPEWFQDRYERFAPIHDWRQIGSVPDFPTVAEITEQNLSTAPEDLGPVDGTLAIDPLGLQAMLRITGPIDVPNWPEPITSENVVDVTLHDAYSAFETNDERIAFLGDTALAVWSRVLSADLSLPKLMSSGLGDAVRSKHLRMHFVRPAEQNLAVALGADGALAEPETTFGLVLQNTAGNKMDFWLERAMDLEVTLQSNGGAAGTAEITLTNNGPASGEPRYVIGPHSDPFRRGWNYQLVRLYLPSGTSVDPETEADQVSSEQGFVVIEWDVAIPPGESATRTARFNIANFWDPGAARAELTVRKQASIHPDDLHLTLEPSWGRRLVSEESSCPEGAMTSDVVIEAEVRSSPVGWVVGPWARDIQCVPGTR